MDATVQKEVSDAILAPVVVNAKTEEGVRPFLSYVDALTRHSNIEIAEAESQRLRPYFSAMSEYVIEALQKPPPAKSSDFALMNSASARAISTGWYSSSPAPATSDGWYWSSSETSADAVKPSQNRTFKDPVSAAIDDAAWEARRDAHDRQDPAKELGSPGALSDSFNSMAATTHATLISDVVIVPSDIKRGPASDLFRGHNEFTAPYYYLGHSIEFGFLQAYEGGLQKSAKSSTTFPVFAVDHAMIDAIPVSQAEPLLRDLQQVLSVVNHDMLHHFTSAMIGANTVYNNQPYYAENPLTAWAKTLPMSDFLGAERYEEWALQSQENILSRAAAKPLVEKARIALDDYMDCLGQIRKALYEPAREESGASKSSSTASERRVGDIMPDGTVYLGISPVRQERKDHEVIDYFGMVMANSLCRAFPLNHELVQHCLDRLETIDPAPESAAQDCAAMIVRKLPADATNADCLEIIRKNLNPQTRDSAGYDGKARAVINSYATLGAEIFPKGDNAVSYKHLKMLQLIKLDGNYARDPAPDRGRLKEFRENMGDYTLTALQAADKLSAPALQQRFPSPPKL